MLSFIRNFANLIFPFRATQRVPPNNYFNKLFRTKQLMIRVVVVEV